MEKIQELAKNMREPKMRDIRALNHIKDDGEREYLLISNLSGIAPNELDDMSFKEYKILQDRLNGFLL